MDFNIRWKKKRNWNREKHKQKTCLFSKFTCSWFIHKALQLLTTRVATDSLSIWYSLQRYTLQATEEKKTQRNSKPVFSIESVYSWILNVSDDFSDRSVDFLFAVQSRLQESFSAKKERDEIRLIDETGKKMIFERFSARS